MITIYHSLVRLQLRHLASCLSLHIYFFYLLKLVTVATSLQPLQKECQIDHLHSTDITHIGLVYSEVTFVKIIKKERVET